MLFDAHTHQNYICKDIISILNFDIAREESLNNIPESFFSTGIHPWYSEIEKVNQQLQILAGLALNKKCLAIGECGIDKLRGPSLKFQIEIFEKQAQLAHEFKKPVIIHAVKSFSEILHLHRKMKPAAPWIIHGFRKDIIQARQLVDKGIVLSLGGDFLNHANILSFFAEIDLDFILFESDKSGYAVIKDLYKKVSEVKNIEIGQLERAIANNFERIFKVCDDE